MHIRTPFWGRSQAVSDGNIRKINGRFLEPITIVTVALSLRNLPSNVADAQFNRCWSLFNKIGEEEF